MDLNELFSSWERKLASQSEEAGIVQHAGDRGENREAILKSFLEDHLPTRYGVVKGEVITKAGKHSPSMDLLIYDKVNCPLLHVGVFTSCFGRRRFSGRSPKWSPRPPCGRRVAEPPITSPSVKGRFWRRFRRTSFDVPQRPLLVIRTLHLSQGAEFSPARFWTAACEATCLLSIKGRSSARFRTSARKRTLRRVRGQWRAVGPSPRIRVVAAKVTLGTVR